MKQADVQKLRAIAHYLVDLMPDDEIGWHQTTSSPGVYVYSVCGEVRSPLNSQAMEDLAIKHQADKDTTIATLTAEKEKVRELVEAVEKLDALDRHHARSGVANYFAKMYAIRGRITTLAAQLKETQDA